MKEGAARVHRVGAIHESPLQNPKHKPYPAYNPTGIAWLGDIPAHWEVRRLKFVARMIYGDSLAVDDREDGEFAVFGSNGQVGTHTRANTFAPAIVIGRKGSFGKVNYSTRPCFAIDTTFYVDERSSKQDLRWLYYSLPSLGLDTISQDSAVPGLSRETAYDNWLPVPPLPEQHAIAAYLDRETARLDALVAKNERLIELLQEKRIALISHAVTRGLDANAPMKDSGVEWLGKVPVDWEVETYRRVVDRIDVGIAEAATHAYTDSGVPIIRSTNVKPNRVETDDIFYIQEWFAEKNRSKYLRAGDIVTVRTGNAGISAVVPPELDRSQCFTLLISTPNNSQDSRFFCYFLNADPGQTFFKLEGWGTAQINISVPILQNVPVVEPPLDEQRAIAAYLDRETAKIDALVAKVRQAIETLKEYRTALISAAVTGKMDVRGL